MRELQLLNSEEGSGAGCCGRHDAFGGTVVDRSPDRSSMLYLRMHMQSLSSARKALLVLSLSLSVQCSAHEYLDDAGLRDDTGVKCVQFDVWSSAV